MDSIFTLTTTSTTARALLHGSKLPPFAPPTIHITQTTSFPTPKPKAPTFSHVHSTPLMCHLRSAAGTLLLAAAALLSGTPTARAISPPPPPPTELETIQKPSPSGLSTLLDSNSESVNALTALVYRKLELGDDAEALRLLERLVAARPDDLEWKFMMARLLNEMGRLTDAREVFDEILERDPLSFEALFENSVLMDQCGDGDAAMERLGRALEIAREENKEKEAREVRLIIAQMKYLQKKVDEALSTYEELAREDPKDYRPYFCQGVIYTLMDRNVEARERFAKYKELSPRKFEVEGFVQTPLSRMKIFGAGGEADN